MRTPTRRAVLAGAAALWARPARAVDAGPCVAALDWNLAASVIDLGLAPVGVAEQALYRAWAGEPALPAGTAELGLRLTPSFETLALLKPDLILINPLNEPLRARLERIAPTFADDTYSAAHAPLARSRDVLRALGARLGRRAEAEALVARTDARLAAAKARLRPAARERLLLPASLIDDRHLTVYGPGSLFDDVLRALGLRNGFAGPTGAWGSALRDLSDLGRDASADLALLAPVPRDAAGALDPDGLLRRVLAARGSRLMLLPPAWPFGGLSTAARFADLVVDALGRAPA